MNVAVAPRGRTVHNADVAELFYRLAELLEIEGANPFRIRAYRRAAATVEDLARLAPVPRLGPAGPQPPSPGPVGYLEPWDTAR